jgi:hypothetical protein
MVLKHPTSAMDSTEMPAAVLRRMARTWRGRVRRCNHHDPNVCTTVLDWREALGGGKLPPDRFQHELRLTRREYDVTLRANDRYVVIDVRGDVTVDTVFSINRPDRIVMTAVSSEGKKIGTWPVFLAHQGAAPSSALEDGRLQAAIQALNLGPEESLHVYVGQAVVYGQPRSEQRLDELVNGIMAVVAALPSATPADTVPKDLPEEFRSLAPLIRAWAFGDDVKRSRAIEGSTRVQLQSLVDRVTPFLQKMNMFIEQDAAAATHTDAAVALGALAECTAEARLALRDK